MCRVSVISSVNDAYADDLAGKTAIVIDVLRATSTIVTALHRGCSGVVPVETVCQAKEYQTQGDLLSGERNGRKVPGFDFGNSPFEYMTPEIRERRIIMTTTNGTRAIHKAARASQVLAACNLNARAAARFALAMKRDIAIVCAGTKDRFSLEDGLCAGLIIVEILEQSGDAQQLKLNDFGQAMKSAYLNVRDMYEDTLLSCTNGKRLARIGLMEEVLYCAQRNVLELVPVLTQDTLLAQVLK